MKLINRYRRLCLMVTLPLLGLASGCSPTLARYTPTTDEARTSLQAALSAWRDGKPYGPVEAATGVQVADQAWQAGHVVEAFEIGEETDNGDGTKQFAVTLKMKKPVGEVSAQYFVHGRDPVWVYREEDYKRMINMDNNPAPASSSKSATRRPGRDR
jgi:hypothetical protein